MKKYFIASDIHSFYNEWMQALSEKGFEIDNENHIIVVLGDLLDRGPDAVKCLNFVNNLSDDRKILIRGNHEDLLETCLRLGMFAWHDYSNGTVNTVEQITKRNLTGKLNMDADYTALVDCGRDPELNKYLNSLVDYYELGDNIFCHGWIPRDNDDTYGCWKDAPKGAWDSARWDNGMSKWKHGRILESKTIYCGHFHTSWGHCYIDKKCSEFEDDADFSPFIKEGIVAIDACTAHTHKVNVVTLEIE